MQNHKIDLTIHEIFIKRQEMINLLESIEEESLYDEGKKKLKELFELISWKNHPANGYWIKFVGSKDHHMSSPGEGSIPRYLGDWAKY